MVFPCIFRAKGKPAPYNEVVCRCTLNVSFIYLFISLFSLVINQITRGCWFDRNGFTQKVRNDWRMNKVKMSLNVLSKIPISIFFKPAKFSDVNS